MKKLKITSINNSLYTLTDKASKSYNVHLKFYNITNTPSIGNYIYISEKLLDENYIEYSNYYNFGQLDDNSGRIITNENNPDVLILEVNTKKEYLKRLYG